MVVPSELLLHRDADPTQVHEVQTVGALQDEWIQFVVSAPVDDDIRLEFYHGEVFSLFGRLSGDLRLRNHDRRCSYFDEVDFIGQISVMVLASEHVDPFFLDVVLLPDAADFTVVEDVIELSFVEDRDHLMLCEAKF
jgi:hypothetical protein